MNVQGVIVSPVPGRPTGIALAAAEHDIWMFTAFGMAGAEPPAYFSALCDLAEELLPAHVVAALRAAIDQYQMQGGQPGRLARYTENCAALVSGMRELGFKTFLPDAVQAPIIVTFHSPPDPAYNFSEFYRRVRDRGFILYPGKLTAVDTFRVGCIGAIGADSLRQAVIAIADALHEMGVELSRQNQVDPF